MGQLYLHVLGKIPLGNKYRWKNGEKMVKK